MDNSILLAIDGSGSRSWRREDGFNSHIFRFYKDFAGVEKKSKEYLHGPSTAGIGEPGNWFKDDGDAVGTIIENGAALIYNMIGENLRANQNITVKDLKINLIGHSRGGFIALKIANILENPIRFLAINRYGDERLRMIQNNTNNSRVLDPINVNFIGLYDSVDMTAQVGSADLSLKNVQYIAHAWRLNKHRTRKSFGGMDIPRAAQQPFDTSHGGVGGDSGYFGQIKPGNDIYCNALFMLDHVQAKTRYDNGISSLVNRGYFDYWRPYDLKLESVQKHVKKVWLESASADEYIRTHAAKVGIVFNGKTPHVACEKDDILLYSELKSKIGI